MTEVVGLTPFLLVASYLCLAALALAVRQRSGARFRDPEIASRGDSAMLPMVARQFLAFALQPLWNLVVWMGLPADAISTVALLLSLASGVSIAAGHLALGGWLYLCSGILDVLDGRMARQAGTASARGAALDSVLDRYADSAVLIGMTWWLRDSWLAVLALIALVGTLLVSYVRARGEGLGVDAKVGLMQRPERVVLLGSTLAISPVIGHLTSATTAFLVVVAVVALIALLTQVTAVRRLLHVMRALSPSAGSSRAGQHKSGWRRLGPASLSALLATAADFGLMNTLVDSLAVSAVVATALGCFLGGGLNFALNRWWTFTSKDHPLPQAARYTIVSGSSALLNSGGVAVMMLLPIGDFRISWLLVRGAVFLCWNFPLQRDYVYGPKGNASDGRKLKSKVLTELA